MKWTFYKYKVLLFIFNTAFLLQCLRCIHTGFLCYLKTKSNDKPLHIYISVHRSRYSCTLNTWSTLACWVKDRYNLNLTDVSRVFSKEAAAITFPGTPLPAAQGIGALLTWTTWNLSFFCSVMKWWVSLHSGIGLKISHMVTSLQAGRKRCWETHLADLHQGHGDAVELVLAGAGDQHFLRGAEAHAEHVLFVWLTRVIALWVHRNLPKTQNSGQQWPHIVRVSLGFQILSDTVAYRLLTMLPGSSSDVEKGGLEGPPFLWVSYSPLSD